MHEVQNLLMGRKGIGCIMPGNAGDDKFTYGYDILTVIPVEALILIGISF